jgi:hypothetical protein
MKLSFGVVSSIGDSCPQEANSWMMLCAPLLNSDTIMSPCAGLMTEGLNPCFLPVELKKIMVLSFFLDIAATVQSSHQIKFL